MRRNRKIALALTVATALAGTAAGADAAGSDPMMEVVRKTLRVGAPGVMARIDDYILAGMIVEKLTGQRCRRWSSSASRSRWD